MKWVSNIRHIACSRPSSKIARSARFDGLLVMVDGTGMADDDGTEVYSALRLISVPPPSALPEALLSVLFTLPIAVYGLYLLRTTADDTRKPSSSTASTCG